MITYTNNDSRKIEIGPDHNLASLGISPIIKSGTPHMNLFTLVSKTHSLTT